MISISIQMMVQYGFKEAKLDYTLEMEMEPLPTRTQNCKTPIVHRHLELCGKKDSFFAFSFL